MSAGPRVSDRDYLASIRAITIAGQWVRQSLTADARRREFAIRQLEQAAQDQESRASDFRAFMFVELQSPTLTEAARERMTGATLVSVLADVQTANVLLAAGEALGETGQKSPSTHLDEALHRLDTTAQMIDSATSSSVAPGAVPGRFGFADMGTTPVPAAASPDLDTAIETFRTRTEETLDTLVAEAQGVVTGVFEKLSGIADDRVIQALERLGGQMPELPRIGRLIRQGIERLRAAIDGLLRLLSPEAMTAIKERVAQFWQDLQEGKQLDTVVTGVLGVEDARKHVTRMLQAGDLQTEELDEGNTALTLLVVSFKESMSIVTEIITVVAFAATLLALIPVINPQVALVTASIYVLVLAAVVLIGRDYTDTSPALSRVRGVREIATDLRAT